LAVVLGLLRPPLIIVVVIIVGILDPLDERGNSRSEDLRPGIV
jgi:hypothetical protein